MKNLIMIAVFSSSILSAPAFAIDCSAVNVKPLSESCEASGRTGVRKDAKARCSASITAPKNYFILGSDIKYEFKSTYEGIKDHTKPQGKQTVSLQKFNFPAEFKGNPLLSSMNIYKSVTANGYCDRSAGSRLGKKCYARAKVTAKSYPISCLKTWLSN